MIKFCVMSWVALIGDAQLRGNLRDWRTDTPASPYMEVMRS